MRRPKPAPTQPVVADLFADGDLLLARWCNALWPLQHVRLLLDTYPTQGVAPSCKATGKSVEAVRKKAYQMGLCMDAAAISESNRRAALFSWRHKARKPRGEQPRQISGAYASIWAVAAGVEVDTRIERGQDVERAEPRRKRVTVEAVQVIEQQADPFA